MTGDIEHRENYMQTKRKPSFTQQFEAHQRK